VLIGWDIDGVLYPWHEIVLEHCKLEKLVDKDVNLKRFFNTIGSESIFNDVFSPILRKNIVTNPIFYERGIINPQTLILLNKLAEMAEFVYITCRPVDTCIHVTKSWIKRSKLPYSSNVYILPDGKINAVKELKCDMYIEDRVDYAKELADVTSLFLLTRPWNEDWKEPSSIFRINSLNELEEVVHGKSK
jgi:hypothetical protein